MMPKLRLLFDRNGQSFLLIAIVIIAIGFFRDTDIEKIILEVKTDLQSYGWIAPFISIFLLLADGVVMFIPISTVALLFANSILFGFWLSLLISFVGMSITALCCYGVGFTVGSRLLPKLDSPDTQNYLKHLRSPSGQRFLVFSRLSIFLPFNIISFLCGIAKLNFTKYLMTTLCCMIPWLFSYSLFGFRFVTQDFSHAIMEFAVLNCVMSLIGYLYWILSDQSRSSVDHS